MITGFGKRDYFPTLTEQIKWVTENRKVTNVQRKDNERGGREDSA